MSRTVRRKNFNKKSRFFQHYWEAFSDKEVINGDYIELWKYHSDNYYTKSTKNNKQYLKNLEDRKIRRNFNKSLHNFDLEDFFLLKLKPNCIKWDLH